MKVTTPVCCTVEMYRYSYLYMCTCICALSTTIPQHPLLSFPPFPLSFIYTPPPPLPLSLSLIYLFPFSCSSREDQLAKLRSGKVYDVLVIGGGATGCGIALDSVLRGTCTCTCMCISYMEGGGDSRATPPLYETLVRNYNLSTPTHALASQTSLISLIYIHGAQTMS